MSVVHYMPEMDQQVQSFENLFSIKWTKTSTFIVFTRIKAAALIKFSHLSSVAVLLRGRLLFESWLPLIASGLQRLQTFSSKCSAYTSKYGKHKGVGWVEATTGLG